MGSDYNGYEDGRTSWNPALRPDKLAERETLASTDDEGRHSVLGPNEPSSQHPQNPHEDSSDPQLTEDDEFGRSDSATNDASLRGQYETPNHLGGSSFSAQGTEFGKDAADLDPSQSSYGDSSRQMSAWDEIIEAPEHHEFPSGSHFNHISGSGDEPVNESNPWASVGEHVEEVSQPFAPNGALVGSDVSSASSHKPTASSAVESASELDEWPDSGLGFNVDAASATMSQNLETSTPTAASHEESTSQVGKDTGPASTDEDLAAMWEAALAEDDFAEGADHIDSGSFFPDDGEGFLDEAIEDSVPFQLLAAGDSKYQASTESAGDFAQQLSAYQLNDAQGAPSANRYRPSMHNRQSLPNPQMQFQESDSRPAQASRAESFADKSKGGYASPYDLPVDITQTRKRSSAQPLVSHFNQPAAPPRSSSMYSATPLSPSTLQHSPPSLSPSATFPQSDHISQSFPAPNPGTSSPSSSQPPSRKASSDFFADLPFTNKPRPSVAQARYVSQGAAPIPPPTRPSPPALAAAMPEQRRVSEPSTVTLASQLRLPERLPPFAEQGPSLPRPPATHGHQAPSRYSPAPAPGPVSKGTRYSPAPPAPQTHATAGPPQARYAPASSGYSVAQALSYAPRTSSPLAHHSSVQQPLAAAPPPHPTQSAPAASNHSSQQPSQGNFPHQRPEAIGDPLLENSKVTASRSTPPPRSKPPSLIGSPRQPQQPQQPPHMAQTSEDVSQPRASDLPYSPPRRSRTQSPGIATKIAHKVVLSNERILPPTHPSPHSVVGAVQNAGAVLGHRRTATTDLQFITPQDERAADHLERWKGYPIFKWGMGGALVYSFPKQIPRYGSGHAFPMIKCSPGELAVHSAKTVCPLSESIARFPGPLKGKSKKKEVSAWLSACIRVMEDDLHTQRLDDPLPQELRTKLDEKALLWKVMLILVDHDGTLDGNPAAVKAVHDLLATASDSGEANSAPLTNGAAQEPLGPASGVKALSEPSDPQALSTVRNLLLQGDREKAVWCAADQRMWGHAMLISSTLTKDVWKQVIQEFVRKEVKITGSSTDSLAALYQTFAGNWEESIDELVPPSARAGFQMVSLDEGINSKRNSLEGLDSWRETLSLILNNRSADDLKALATLGRLLASYGRIEAAHICYLFAGPACYFGGSDDPQSNIALIGADHINQPLDYDRDLESVLLTEVYEYAMSLSSAGPQSPMPHLQSHKFHHAICLAEYGLRSEAQAYCDAIAASIKSNSRPSAYYHPNLLSQLDELTKRLSQSPKDGSSWMSKPSMEKVSGTVWAKFNSFIAGEEADAAATASAQGATTEAGPFAQVAGTPTMSPTTTDPNMHGLYAGNQPSPLPALSQANSRYAPQNSSQVGAGLYQPQRESPLLRNGSPTNTAPSIYSPRSGSDSHSQNVLSSPYAPADQQHPAWQPFPNTGAPYGSIPNQSEALSSTPLNLPSQISQAPPLEQSRSYGFPSTLDSAPEGTAPDNMVKQPPRPYYGSMNTAPTRLGEQAFSDNTSAKLEDRESDVYQPPASSYEAPSYEPYVPDSATGDESEDPPMKKKNTFMDDDDNDELERRAAELKKQQKAQADREADEAFKKAAEADGKKETDAHTNKS